MGYARHVFRRPLCDYPGCGRPLEAAADWYFDMDTMVDAVTGPGGVPSSCWAPMGRRSAWCVRTATSTGTSC